MANLVPNTNRESQRYRGFINDIGRLGAHALFPNDFEAYFVSLELTDSRGITERFITFPVTPSQITEMQPSMVNVKKSASGVIAIDTESFIPSDIEIKGNFGRNLRFAIGSNILQGGAIAFTRGLLEGDIQRPTFSPVVKSGYGFTKSLEEIIKLSHKLDSKGNPRRLYLYNPILGNNYLVKAMNFVHSQNIAENMIPQYTLQLKSVAPLNLQTRFDTDIFDKIDQGIEEAGRQLKKTLESLF